MKNTNHTIGDQDADDWKSNENLYGDEVNAKELRRLEVEQNVAQQTLLLENIFNGVLSDADLTIIETLFSRANINPERLIAECAFLLGHHDKKINKLTLFCLFGLVRQHASKWEPNTPEAVLLSAGECKVLSYTEDVDGNIILSDKQAVATEPDELLSVDLKTTWWQKWFGH